MPEALSTKPVPYQHSWTPGGRSSISTGWAYPPRDYKKWAELVYQWVRHAVDRYGRAEVETWYWEVWNEPNIFYWRGTPEEYHRLYDHRRRRREAGPAHCAGRRPARRRAEDRRRPEVPPGLPRPLSPRHEPCHRGDRLPARFHRIPRQGRAPVRRRTRPDRDRRAAPGHRPRLRGRRELPRAEGQADDHRRIGPGRLRRLPVERLSTERISQRHALRQLHRRLVRPQV